MNLYILTRASGNYGTVVFAVVAKDEIEAKEKANATYPPPRVAGDFYKVESCALLGGAVLWSENNE